jgi:hypothetical protein
MDLEPLPAPSPVPTETLAPAESGATVVQVRNLHSRGSTKFSTECETSVLTDNRLTDSLNSSDASPPPPSAAQGLGRPGEPDPRRRGAGGFLVK